MVKMSLLALKPIWRGWIIVDFVTYSPPSHCIVIIELQSTLSLSRLPAGVFAQEVQFYSLHHNYLCTD